MGCFTLCFIAWRPEAGSNPGGAKARTGGSANTIPLRRTARKPWAKSGNSGQPFHRCCAIFGRSNLFDLEKAVKEWRRRMVAAGVKTEKVLNELESHLRDDLARQVISGSSPEAAFELAVRKIGESDAIAMEFEKTGKEVRERKIKLLCIIFVALIYPLPFILSIPKPWISFEPVQRWLAIAA